MLWIICKNINIVFFCFVFLQILYQQIELPVESRLGFD